MSRKRHDWNRVSALILLVCALAAGSACTLTTPAVHPADSAQQGVAVGDQRAVLWRLEKDGRGAGYVYGTIHSGDPRVMPPPARVFEALAKTGLFIMELIPDEAALISLRDAMLQPHGQTLDKILGEDLYQKTAALFEAEYAYPEPEVNKLRPWAALMILSVPRPEHGVVLDELMYQTALASAMPVRGLESVHEQVEVFAGMDPEDQIALLAEMVQQHDLIRREYEKLISMYVARDLAAMEALSHEYLNDTDRGLTELLLTRAVHDRNLRMAERLLPLLEQQTAFIAVGALHLPGEHGLLRLLELQGYHVQPVR